MSARWSLRPAVAAVVCVCLLAPRAPQAEFYQWTDERGQARISNLPPRSVRADGSIDPEHHAGSLAGQQAALRARFQQRDEELARAAVDQSAQVAPAPELESARTK